MTSEGARSWLEVPFWTRALPEAALCELAAVSVLRPFEPREVCIRAGLPVTHVVFLARGIVTVFARGPARDDTLLLGILEGPSLFGDAEWAAEQPFRCSLRGETDGMLVRIPVETFAALVSRHPKLAYQLYRDACARHLLANHTAQVNAFHDVPVRVLRLLLDYAYRFGVPRGDHIVVEHRLPQTGLAAALGVNRRTVARAVEDLVREGVVEPVSGGWVLHHVAQLEPRLPSGLLGLSSRAGEAVAAVLDPWDDGGPSHGESDGGTSSGARS